MIKQLYKRKITVSSEAKRVIFECALFLIALFLTPVKFIFGTLPFGIVLCASAKKDAPFAFVGAIFSCIFFVDERGVYIIAFISLFILRALVTFLKKPESEVKERFGVRLPHIFGELFCENIFLRVLISLSVAFGIGIYYTVVGGYMLYDVFALVFFVCAAPLLTYLASGAWEGGASRGFYIGIAVVGFMITFALRGRALGGFDLSVFLSFILVLYVSKNASTVWGVVLSALLSLCIEPRFALCLIICALVFGVLSHLSTLLAILCAAILSSSYAVWAGGYDAFAHVVPELVSACVLVFPILQLDLLPLPKIRVHKNAPSSFESAVVLKELHQSSSIISHAFLDAAGALTAADIEAKSITPEAFKDDARRQMTNLCVSCPKEEICWSRDTETTERAFRSICEGAYYFGSFDGKALEEKFVHRCPSLEKIGKEAVELSLKNFESGIKNNRLEISACALELAAKISCELSFGASFGEKNHQLTKKAEKSLIKSGLCFEGVEILGTKMMRAYISGIDTSRSKISISKAADVLSKDLKIPFDEPTVISSEETTSVEIPMLPTHKTSYSKRSISLDKETSGDTLCAFGGGARSFYLVCDGMGTGRSAHTTSNMCASFLSSLLPITNETEACLGAINSFVRAKGDELSTSVDLLEIDNITGEATFFKSGACVSLIKRAERVFSLSSRTAPIGIMKRLDCQRLSFTLEGGDVCVMISDGLLGERGDYSYIEELLKKDAPPTPSELSEEIVNEFLKTNEQRDDLSVFVIYFE